MEQMQEELASMEVDGTSGGGMVKVVVNGKGDMLKITLDPSIVSAEERKFWKT